MRPPPAPPSYFSQSFAFFNHYEEIQTVLFEAELIISNAHLKVHKCRFENQPISSSSNGNNMLKISH